MPEHRRSRERVDELVSVLGPGPWPIGAVLEQGWTPRQLRLAVDAGRLRRPHRGVVDTPAATSVRPRAVTSVDVGRELREVRAALLVARRGAVVSHESAALVHGLWTPSPGPVGVQLTVPGEPDRLDHGMRIRGSRLPRELVCDVHGLPVTTVARTAVDLARGEHLSGALVALDGAARLLLVREHGTTEVMLRDPRLRADLLGLVSPALEAAYDSERGWPGTVVVRRALALVDPASESPLESRSRGWMLAAGLPRPVTAFPVCGVSGRQYYADFAWPAYRVLGEADGTGKYGLSADDVRRALRLERERQRDLEDAGWTVVRWDVGERRRVVVGRLTRALTAHPARRH